MRKRILLVEEDVVGLNMLSQLLSCKGYEVCGLYRSSQIMNEIPKLHPDLILLDENMTGVNSNVVSRALKAMDGVSKIPVMLISGKKYAYGSDETNGTNMLDIDILVQKIEHELAA